MLLFAENLLRQVIHDQVAPEIGTVDVDRRGAEEGNGTVGAAAHATESQCQLRRPDRILNRIGIRVEKGIDGGRVHHR